MYIKAKLKPEDRCKNKEECLTKKLEMDNPDLPIEFIKDILIAKSTDSSLAEPFEFEDKN